MQYWALWANGHLETTLTADTGGTKNIAVVARGDDAGGVWPNVRISLDGTVVVDIAVTTGSWRTYTAVTTLSKGTHTLRVQFTNDATVNGEDRNLTVDLATLVPALHEWKKEAETFTTRTAGAATSSSLASAGSFWNLWSDGHISTSMTAASSGRKTIRVVARGTSAGGVYPLVNPAATNPRPSTSVAPP